MSTRECWHTAPFWRRCAHLGNMTVVESKAWPEDIHTFIDFVEYDDAGEVVAVEQGPDFDTLVKRMMAGERPKE